MSDEITIYERDVWIVSYLRNANDGKRTIREIWDAARLPRDPEAAGDVRGQAGLAETASLPTYHRTIGKLVARGQLIMEGESADGGATFRLAPQVSSVTAISQSDLNEALWDLGPTQALAHYQDVMEQFEARAPEILQKAAAALSGEEPRALVLRMLQDRARELDEDIADLRDPETAEDEHRRLVARKLKDFAQFVHSELGINPCAWRIPSIEEIGESAPVHVTPVNNDWSGVISELELHVFGSRFIEFVDIAKLRDDRVELIVAGTDGSSHIGKVRGMPASAYSDDERLMMTFNNGAGYVDVPASFPQRYPTPYHGVPATRATLEDPSHRGMIISRPWFEDLNDGEFEHMKKAALDVVQFRIDEALLSGNALPFGSHPMTHAPALPRPNVLIRDGAVAPQARELQNYTNRTAYGEIVREGIRLSYRILNHVRDSERRVFAGAVKFTQLRTFSRIVNWYIQRGSAHDGEAPIDVNWRFDRSGVISDSIAMTRLLGALPELSRPSQAYRTCVIVRPFPAMVTALNRRQVAADPSDWPAYFQRQLDREVTDYQTHRGEPPYFMGREVGEDDYVRMCMHADYGMFYFGRPGGSPQLTFPRFEFLDSIRARPEPQRTQRVIQSVDMIMAGIHRTKWAQDRDHNMMTERRLPKLLPYVVYEAHEKCKVLGHKLASELQQAIAASLSQIKAMRGLAVPKIDIEPVSMNKFRQYLRRLRHGALERGEPVGDSSTDTGSADLPPDERSSDVPPDGLGE